MVDTGGTIASGGNNGATSGARDRRPAHRALSAAPHDQQEAQATFGILGPVEAWVAERPLELGGRRQLTLLALLIQQANRAISTDVLIDYIWGGDAVGGGKRLSVAISRLRRALEPLHPDRGSPLKTVGGGYLLALDPGDLDAWRFEALIQEGLGELDAGAPAAASARLGSALALWRGPAFGEIGYEDFVRSEAERLEELRLLALEARIDADLQLGGHAGVVPELRSLLSANPTRERLAWLLMIALYRSGRQAEALEVYAEVRTHLREELGLDPGIDLGTLQSDILRQSSALGPVAADVRWSVDAPSAPGSAVVTMLAALSSAPAADEALARICAHYEATEVLEQDYGWLAVFESAEPALEAARELVAPELRLGVHTGRLRINSTGPWGEDVHLAAGLASAAHEGQVLVSAVTAGLAPGAPLADLGEGRVDDFAIPIRVFGLGAGPHPRPRTGDPLRSNLPASAVPLIGREREHGELMSIISAGEDRLVTISGSGGSGKTALALAVAEEWVHVLADGTFLVPLAQIGGPSGVAAAIAAQLAIPLDAAEDPADVIGRALTDRDLLLVLDNFEHVLDAAPLLGNLLARAPRLRVLVTSQAPLRVRRERLLRLGPLSVPQADDVASVTEAAATRLLVLRARRVNPGFELSDENAPALARLARALDGLPLAIELAAARLQLLSPDQLLARLDRGIEALGHGSRDLPERQRGLRAALDWTHDLLSEDEAVLLRRLGVFAGPVSLDRVEQVCAGSDQLDPLGRLHDLSLVTRAGDGRLLLHPGVRRYVRDKLAAAGEQDDLARHHAEAFAEAAEGWGRRILFEMGAIESVVVSEEPDIGQALTWASTNDLDCFARLAGGAAAALLWTARMSPWSQLIERVLAGSESDRAPAGEALAAGSRAWLLLAGSLTAFQRRDAPLARSRALSACVAAERSADSTLACLMGAYSVIFAVLGGATEGLRREYASLSERAAALPAHELLGLVSDLEPYILAYCEGRHAEAAVLWARLAQERTRTDFAAWTAPFCLPDCHLLERDHAAALVSYLAALRSARERGQPPTVAYQLEGMAIALSGLGRHEDALETAGWAESVRRTAGPAVNRWFRELLARALSDSRAALPARAAAEAYARGLGLPLDAAVDAALALDAGSK